MIDMNAVQELVGKSFFILVPIITGLIMIVKRLIPERHRKAWTPALSLMIGVGVALLVNGLTRQAAIIGVILGLSASGLWSAAKNPLKAVGDKVVGGGTNIGGLMCFPLIILLFMSGSMTACSSHYIQENPVVAEVIFKSATSRVLAEKPDWAGPMRDIAAVAIDVVDGDEFISLDELEVYARQQVPWDVLTIEEQILVDVLISAIKAEVNKAVKDSEISGDAGVQTVQILYWIHDTAARYAEQAEEG
jgi:hypothetical protein